MPLKWIGILQYYFGNWCRTKSIIEFRSHFDHICHLWPLNKLIQSVKIERKISERRLRYYLKLENPHLGHPILTSWKSPHHSSVFSLIVWIHHLIKRHCRFVFPDFLTVPSYWYSSLSQAWHLECQILDFSLSCMAKNQVLFINDESSSQNNTWLHCGKFIQYIDNIIQNFKDL